MSDPKPIGDVIASTFGGGSDDEAAEDSANGREPGPLGDFEDEHVLAARVRIRGAGTGLNGALDVAPIAHRRGDKVYALLELDVDKVYFEGLKEVEDAVARVHDCVTVMGTVLDPKTAERLLKDTKRAIQKARDEAEGLQQLPGTEES